MIYFYFFYFFFEKKWEKKEVKGYERPPNRPFKLFFESKFQNRIFAILKADLDSSTKVTEESTFLFLIFSVNVGQRSKVIIDPQIDPLNHFFGQNFQFVYHLGIVYN